MKNVINRALVSKKKVIFTLMLTLVSSVWMTNKANWCMPMAHGNMYQQWISVHGVIKETAYPCEPGEECPVCLTIALQANETLYYMTAANEEIEGQLDALHQGAQVTISGTPYKWGSFDYIHVGSIDTTPLRLNSLCDEWNVLEFRSNMGFVPDEYNMRHYHLTTDTIIAGQRYIRLYGDNSYMGAMREGNNRDIYYIPAGTTHEYLLYAFNAQIGDELTDLWLGRTTNEVFTKEYFPYGVNATVEEITETSPRRFVLSTGYITTEEGVENYPYYFEWIEGIGFASAPDGADYPLPYAGGFTSFLLCAYKNGEHIYTSDLGEQYGCEYNYNPSQPMFPSDTKWHYVYTEMYGGPDFKPRYFSVSPIDTVINNTHYQKINGILFRSDATKVWCVIDSMDTRIERLVYDFDLQVGDSIRKLYYDEEPYCEELHYAKVTNVEYIQLGDGRMARRLSYDNRLDDIEHIGCVDGIFAPLNLPVSTCGCGDYFQCCTRGDVLLYEVESGACDTFFVKEQPADTIPVYSYTGDDPGSSTVDPVDPNQVVVTLKGDNMTVKESSGDEISMELTYITKNAPSEQHTAETETFTNSVSLKLTEEGSYTITLTNPKWNYKVSGKFDYPKKHEGIGEVQSDNEPCTKVLRDGQLLIRRGEKLYNLQGAVITE